MPSPIFKSKNMDRLDTHENFPAGFREYLENYGWHFSKKMCEFAVSRMKDRNGKKIEPYSKDKVDALLKQYGIELKKDKGYDCVYVCTPMRSCCFVAATSMKLIPPMPSWLLKY